MQQMSRAQRMLLVYILLKLREPRVIQQITKLYGGGGGITEAQAIAAVEGEATLDLTGVIPDSAYPNALLLDGTRAMTDFLEISGALKGIRFDSAYDVSIIPDTYGTDQVRIVNRAGQSGVLRGLRCGLFQGEDMAYLQDGYIRTQGNYAKYFTLQGLFDTSFTDFVKILSESSANAKDGGFILYTFTDATRGNPAIAGRVIYNSDDNGLNVDDGTNWRDTNGNIT